MDSELLNAISSLMDEKLAPIKDGQARLEAKVEKLEEDVDFVRGRLIIVEQEHGKKLDAIYDGYCTLDEKLDRQSSYINSNEHRIDRLEVSVGVHDLKLEQLVK